ncbi:MAG: DUF3365 domain-containing protein [Nitrospirae bacterium]|nr:DUF3365 domain-containing protein [Nitrospirota bacterium]
MFGTIRNIRISTFHNIVVLLVFLIAGGCLVFVVTHYIRQNALAEAQVRARILLDRNLATHAYYSHNLKPALFALTDPYRPKDYFDPTWMSSTYAVRELNKYFKSLGTQDYYYKECAINARSPENEADDYERAFILRLNTDPKLVEHTAVRTIEGKPYFVVLRRGEVLEKDCMRCHSTPANAPGGLVRQYGAERSFHRSTGDVVSAISIRVPLAAAYAETNRVSLMISGVLLFALAILYAFQFLINRRLLFAPLNNIRDKAEQIATDERYLGEVIDISSGKELQDMIAAFNTMSVNLRHGRDYLEERVQERTRELQKALDSVKTLRGMLPICSSCKKIRNDDGYWSQIEVYVRDHSDAEFSHGICPECANKLYPDYFPEKK